MITSNPLLAQARGGLGKIVIFKQMYGKTVMTNYPRKANIPREKQSAAQRATRDNFRDAAAFAKEILKDPVQKAYYEKKKKQIGLPSAYLAAIADYMRNLKLESVNCKKYTGKIGGQIAMTIRKKDFGATAVKVTLISARTGQMIESGNAMKNESGAWIYRNKVKVDDAADTQVQITARGAVKWEGL